MRELLELRLVNFSFKQLAASLLQQEPDLENHNGGSQPPGDSDDRARLRALAAGHTPKFDDVEIVSARAHVRRHSPATLV